MRIKNLILNEVAPQLEAHGLHLIPNQNYNFANEGRTRFIEFDFPRMDRLKLRITISARGKLFCDLELNRFPHLYRGEYSTQAELNELVRKATSMVLHYILPYLDQLEEVFILPDQDLYDRLSVEPERRCAELEKRYNISHVVHGHWNTVLSPVIESLQHRNISLRREDFERHRDEIVDIAAFIGEWRRAQDARLFWGWVAPKEYPSWVLEKHTDRLKIFGPLYSQEDTQPAFDPIGNILYAWNFSDLRRQGDSSFVFLSNPSPRN